MWRPSSLTAHTLDPPLTHAMCLITAESLYVCLGRGLLSGSGMGYLDSSSRWPRGVVPGVGPIMLFMDTSGGPSGGPWGEFRSLISCSGWGEVWSPMIRFSSGLSGLSVPPVPTM